MTYYKEKGGVLVSKTDHLGRLVIPKALREKNGLFAETELSFSQEGDGVLVSKKRKSCVFCKSEKDLCFYREKSFCRDCLEELKKR